MIVLVGKVLQRNTAAHGK